LAGWAFPVAAAGYCYATDDARPRSDTAHPRTILSVLTTFNFQINNPGRVLADNAEINQLQSASLCRFFGATLFDLRRPFRRQINDRALWEFRLSPPTTDF